jgi:hypothetical protein
MNMALPSIEQAIIDYISQPGGQFSTKQAEALRQVFQKIVDELESVEERVTILEP